MRIIGGEFRRRKLLSPPETAQTRPIPDRVKEALFNLLRGNVEGAVVVDVFSGTGPIGLEALSRGAASCTFVEKDRRVAGVLRQNIDTLGCGDRATVVVADALGAALEHRLPDRIDLLFFDPPYPLMRLERSAERVLGQFGRLIGHLSDDGFAVLRTPWPYVVEVSAPPGLGAAGPSGRRSGRRREEEEEFFKDLDDLSEAMEEEAEEANDRPAAERRPGNLKVPGAAGPECHPYGSTALQLYMRERKPGGDSHPGQIQSA